MSQMHCVISPSRLAAVMLLVTTMVRAQAVQIPPRDRPSGPPPQPVGTGAIKGRVVDAQTGSAVARAHVRLNWMGPAIPRPPVQALRLPKSGRGTAQPRNGTNTNDLGEFRLARLEPGKYLVFVMPQRREMFFGPGAPSPDQAELQPVPTYYPGVPAIDQAQPI